jgi:transcriptional regulator GlxA family with amidase domain
MFCSTRQLQRRLKEYTGQTPADYLNSIRLNKSYQYLTQGTYPTVSATARALGFRDTVYFSRKFREHFGILPSEV